MKIQRSDSSEAPQYPPIEQHYLNRRSIVRNAALGLGLATAVGGYALAGGPATPAVGQNLVPLVLGADAPAPQPGDTPATGNDSKPAPTPMPAPKIAGDMPAPQPPRVAGGMPAPMPQPKTEPKSEPAPEPVPTKGKMVAPKPAPKPDDPAEKPRPMGRMPAPGTPLTPQKPQVQPEPKPEPEKEVKTRGETVAPKPATQPESIQLDPGVHIAGLVVAPKPPEKQTPKTESATGTEPTSEVF